MVKSEIICLVTGASSGIGFAIAKALGEDNHKVIATARRSDRLNELKPFMADTVAGDLNSVDFRNSLINDLFDKYGKCDYLFNCAGMAVVGKVDEIETDKIAAMLRLNVESTFLLTYTMLKRFKKQGYGHVVNISSVLGTKVRATAGAYAATKYALEALSEALRMELSGTDIQVSCIEPGLVMTELHKDWETHPMDSMGIHQPLTVDNIVEAVRFIMRQPGHVRIPRVMILPKDHNI